MSNRSPGSRLRAAAIMSAELSRPLTAAAEKRAANNPVELPGPQPMAMAVRASIAGSAASRSRTGLVRSSSNCTYCWADQFSRIRYLAAGKRGEMVGSLRRSGKIASAIPGQKRDPQLHLSDEFYTGFRYNTGYKHSQLETHHGWRIAREIVVRLFVGRLGSADHGTGRSPECRELSLAHLD